MSLFNELKRRNVFRVAAAYVVISWLLIQVIGLAADSFSAPEWVMKMIIVVLLIGFIPTLFFSWAFELTPEGLKKESEIATEQSITNHTAKKLDVITLVAVMLIFGLLFVDRYFPHQDKPLISPTASSSISSNQQTKNENRERSIAVLPFIALSSNLNDQYFGKGIAEELLNALAQFPDLKVSARTSSFSFEGKNIDLSKVGEILGVAHVLEGSVRSSGNKVRVTAQLIRTSDGIHLWSKTYDGNLDDLFAVQDEIVTEISHTLQIRLGVGSGAVRSSAFKVDPNAYQNYLRGLELWSTRSIDENRTEAIKSFRLTTSQDPVFADGWATYGVSLAYSLPSEAALGMNIDQHLIETKKALEMALQLEPENVRAMAGLVVVYLGQDLNIEKATVYAEEGVRLAPNASESYYSLGYLFSLKGDFIHSLQAYERAATLDPLNLTVSRFTGQLMASHGDYIGFVEYRQKCKDCSDLIFEYDIDQFLAARRGGTSQQIRQSAVQLHKSVINSLKTDIHFDNDYASKFWLKVTEPKMVEWQLGGVKPQSIEFLKTINVDCLYCFFTGAMIMANLGDFDLAFLILNRSMIGQHFNLYLIVEPLGLDVWPDDFRRDPRFHTFWQRPGMPELAEILRKNGKDAALPLPVNGTNQ